MGLAPHRSYGGKFAEEVHNTRISVRYAHLILGITCLDKLLGFKEVTISDILKLLGKSTNANN